MSRGNNPVAPTSEGEYSRQSGGKPPNRPRNKNYNRMNTYNADKAKSSYDDRMTVDEKHDEWKGRSKTSMSRVAPPRSRNGPPPSRQMAADQVSNVFDIDMFHGAEPVQANYCQNLDHANFDLIMDVSHESIRNVDATFARKVPLVEYRHYNTMLLNAKILDVDRKQNHQNTLADEGDVMDLFPTDIAIHQPIYEYLANIGECITPSGDHVKMNLPNAAIPRLALAARQRQGEIDVPAIDAGSFGPIRADNHNAYESYISPLVTRRAIENQILNLANDEWQPLPDGAYPNGSHPTRNLLGWMPIHPIHRDAVESLNRITFHQDNDLQLRLQYSGHIVSQVSMTLRDLSTGIRPRIKVGLGIPPPRTSLSTTGVLVTTDRAPGDLRLSSATVQHPYIATVSLTKQVGIIGMKRRRNDTGRGLAYLTAANAAPQGWLATINYNYEMIAPFLPARYVDDPSLRVLKFRDFGPSCTRDVLLSDWIIKKCSV